MSSYRYNSSYYSDSVLLKEWGIGLAVVLVLAGILFYLINPHQTDVIVTDSYWTRTIDIEQYNRHEAESETVPAGATVIGRRWVVDGYWMDMGETCYGYGENEYCTDNGSMWVDTSAYHYKYFWFQWDVDHKLVAQARDKKLYYPEWTGNHPDNQRMGNRYETCTLVFTDKEDKVFNYNLPYDQWFYFNVKDKASIQVNHFGVVSEAHVTESNTPY